MRMPDIPKPKKDNIISLQSSLTMSKYVRQTSRDTRYREFTEVQCLQNLVKSASESLSQSSSL